MARPSVPLIVRPVVLERALDLIEEVGYEKFSLPRLAKMLGVQPPSLYHHFANRAELLMEAAQSVILTADLPPRDLTKPWTEYCKQSALAMREMILRRPGVAPLIVWYLSTIGLPAQYEAGLDALRAYGVPEDYCHLILDGVERITIGSVSVDAMRNRAQNPRYGKATPPDLLSDAAGRRHFETTLRVFLAGVAAEIDDLNHNTGTRAVS